MPSFQRRLFLSRQTRLRDRMQQVQHVPGGKRGAGRDKTVVTMELIRNLAIRVNAFLCLNGRA